jgi:hypothetical protein
MTTVVQLQGAAARYFWESGVFLVSAKIVGAAKSYADETTRISRAHETIHHLHALTSPFIYSSRLRLYSTIPVILRHSSELELREALASFSITRERFRYRAFGVSVTDLLEGASVVETFRLHYPHLSATDFVAYRNLHFAGKGNSQYRRTFDIMSRAISVEAAFRHLSLVSFLALYHEVPGYAFDLLLRNGCGRELDSNLFKAAAQPGIENFQPLPFWNPTEGRSSGHDTIFDPYLRSILKHISADTLAGIAARPTSLRGMPLSEDQSDHLRPPVEIGPYRVSDGARSLGYGPAKDNPDLVWNSLVWTAFVYVADQLLNADSYHVPCVHHQCPSYPSGLCSGYFVPPKNYANCPYGTQYFPLWTGSSPQEFALRLRDFRADQAKALDLADVFPSAGEVQPLTTYADQMDEDLDLDPEDNDVSVNLSCAQCGLHFSMEVSKKRVGKGFTSKCPSCGAERNLDIENSMVLKFE